MSLNRQPTGELRFQEKGEHRQRRLQQEVVVTTIVQGQEVVTIEWQDIPCVDDQGRPVGDRR
jgi:hypothetical protein